MNFSGTLLPPHPLSFMPPLLLISSAKTWVIFIHRSAFTENGPVEEMVVPKTTGSVQEPSFATAALAATERAKIKADENANFWNPYDIDTPPEFVPVRTYY